MSTGSNKSLPPSSPRQLEKSEIEKLLQSGLGDFSLRELLGGLLSSLAQAERGAYLPMAFIRARCGWDRCPSRWRSHAAAAGNFARPRCPPAISAATVRKLSRCCWAC
jgi:hypothetical protein